MSSIMSSGSFTIVSIFILVSILIDSANAILSDQQFFIESKRDVGTIYSLEIVADTKSMTLTMEGPANWWMGVSFGAEDMFNVPAYVYYLDDTDYKWVFAERYLIDEEGPGEVIEIIDENSYDISHENGTTTIIFTRPFIGTHSKSFTLSDDDSEFHYGFARGTDGIMAYHAREGRSHSVYTLLHDVAESDFSCSTLDGMTSECTEKIDDQGDQLCGYNSITDDCYEIIRRSNTNNNLFNSDNSNNNGNTLKDILIIILSICCFTVCVVCTGVYVYFHRKVRKPNPMTHVTHQQVIPAQSAENEDDKTKLVTLQEQDQTA